MAAQVQQTMIQPRTVGRTLLTHMHVTGAESTLFLPASGEPVTHLNDLLDPPAEVRGCSLVQNFVIVLSFLFFPFFIVLHLPFPLSSQAAVVMPAVEPAAEAVCSAVRLAPQLVAPFALRVSEDEAFEARERAMPQPISQLDGGGSSDEDDEDDNGAGTCVRCAAGGAVSQLDGGGSDGEDDQPAPGAAPFVLICDWSGCGLAFESSRQLEAHISSLHATAHDYPFGCQWEDCVANRKPMLRRADLLAHMHSHVATARKVPADQPGTPPWIIYCDLFSVLPFISLLMTFHLFFSLFLRQASRWRTAAAAVASGRHPRTAWLARRPPRQRAPTRTCPQQPSSSI